MSDAETLHTLSVDAPQAGMRLDKWLAEALPELSRSRLKALIEDGRLASGSEIVADPSRKVRAGEHYRLSIPAPAPARPQPEQIALCVVYEDDQLIVVDKPAGMVVHPAPGNTGATLVNALLHHCGASLSGIGGERRPGIVHRLDKDTSGLIVVAKNDHAHALLGAMFSGREIRKTYIALVQGAVERAKGTIRAAVARDRVRRTRMTTHESGRSAVSHYEVVERLATAFGKFTLVRVRIETGRTHQIRVHMASLGYPVVGDTLYGAASQLTRQDKSKSNTEVERIRLGRNFLHAARLEFTHPLNGKPLVLEAPLPEELTALLERLKTESTA